MGILLRNYESVDCKEMAALFFDTVHSVNAQDYTREQLDVWATGTVDPEAWDRSFSEHDTVVAVCDGKIVGFGDMDPEGYLDRLYTHRDYQRKGIAAAICHKLEQQCPAERIYTHASITARPFFEQRGYRVLKKQQVERQGILLTNFVMEKRKRGQKDQS